MEAASPPETELRGLKRRSEYLWARDGLTERRRTLVVQARQRAEAVDNRIVGAGFTATRKIGGAVQRNRAKRRLRQAARLILPRHARPGWDYVFIARAATLSCGWDRLLDDMESALISLARD
jgi:ribonuclease P protein component